MFDVVDEIAGRIIGAADGVFLHSSNDFFELFRQTRLPRNEALEGRRVFAAETVSDILAAVLGREPDWAALPQTTPASVRILLHRCLEKEPRRRLHDIADARIEIDD